MISDTDSLVLAREPQTLFGRVWILRIVRMLLIILAVAAYFSLSVIALGGLLAFFSHPPLIALTVAVGFLAVASFLAGGNLSSGVREDRANRWVIPVLTLIGLLDAYLPALTDRYGFWSIDGETIRWLGVILFVAGGVLRIWPVYVLGHRFSGLVAIQPGHTLMTEGIYSTIRHPSYLGLLINTLGWSLAFRSGVGVLLTMLMVVPILARIHAEEGLLLTEFGDEFNAYRARTSRLIPGIY